MGIEIETDIHAADEITEELRQDIERHENRPTPNIEQTERNLGTAENPRKIKVGAHLDEWQKKEFTELLTAYQDVFAWSYQDMPGLDTSIVEHELPLDPSIKPVKQKLRRLKPEWSLKVKEEVVKEFNAGFPSGCHLP